MHDDTRTYQALARLKAQGFTPPAILDIGAYDGDWARGARRLFPEAFILMLDALTEKGPRLGNVCRDIGNASHLIRMIGPRDEAAASFFVVNAPVGEALVQTGSSRFPEESSAPKEQRTLPQLSLATILRGARTPFRLAKLDIQGSELDALSGAGPALDQIEVIMMEVGILPYNRGAPLITDVVSQLAAWGFVVGDIGDEHRHWQDQSMVQLDMIFLRETSQLRHQPPYF